MSSKILLYFNCETINYNLFTLRPVLNFVKESIPNYQFFFKLMHIDKYSIAIRKEIKNFFLLDLNWFKKIIIFLCRETMHLIFHSSSIDFLFSLFRNIFYWKVVWFQEDGEKKLYRFANNVLNFISSAILYFIGYWI